MTKIAQYQVDKSEYAEVISVQHPLVKAQGFSNINPGEMVLFDDKSLGQVLSYNANELKLMVFSKKPVKVGSKLYRTNKQLSFPITASMFGSVYSPLGELLISGHKKTPDKEETENGKKTEEKTTNKPEQPEKSAELAPTISPTSEILFRDIYLEPRKITQRRRVTQQLVTGFSITDILLPMGEGQRELLIGDRKSGKSLFAKNLAVKQALIGNKVVYAMVAKKTADIKETYDFFAKQGVADSVVIIATTPKDSILPV